MNLPNAKALKKLAVECRKAGITHFKCADFEFTLDTSSIPTKSKKKISTPDSTFETDTVSENELLFWSSGSMTVPEKTEEQ